MKQRAAVFAAGAVAVVLAGVGVTVAVAASGEPPAQTGGQELVIESTTSTPSSTVVTSTSVVGLTSTLAETPAQPTVQDQPAAGDNGEMNAPVQNPAPAADEPTGDVTTPAPLPIVECRMDYSDPDRPQGIEVCTTITP